MWHVVVFRGEVFNCCSESLVVVVAVAVAGCLAAW